MVLLVTPSGGGGFFLVFLVLAAFLVAFGKASVIRAEINEGSPKKLFFISKFCYSTAGVGELSINTWRVRNDTDLRLLFFDDDLWAQVTRGGLTCQQIRDKVDGVASGQAALREGTNLTFNIAARSRPRYWYAAFSRCAPGPMRFRFELQFLNDGDWWDQQFSVDQQGLLVMFIVYFILYAIINLCNFAYYYTRPTTATRLFKVFALVALVEGTSNFCSLVHYALYANDGIGVPSLTGLAEVLSLAVVLSLMGLLVLMGRGWGLTSRTLSNVSGNMLIVVTALYCLYVAFYLWSDLDIDPVSTDTRFETAPGVVDLVLRTIIWTLFMFGICMVLLDKGIASDGDKDQQPPHPTRERRDSDDVEPDDEERLLRRSRRRQNRQTSGEAEAEEEEEAEEREGGAGEEDTRREAADGATSSPLASAADPPEPALEQQADKLAAKKRFFIGLAIVGTLWFLSVPLMVALSEGFPEYYRLKAVVALSYTVNFVIIALICLWLYPERDGLQLVNGGGVFLDLSWPTFGGRSREWQEIKEPLLPSGATSASSVTSTSAPATSSNQATTLYTNESGTSRGREGAGNAQGLYDSL